MIEDVSDLWGAAVATFPTYAQQLEDNQHVSAITDYGAILTLFVAQAASRCSAHEVGASLALAVVEEAKVSLDIIVGSNVYVVGWLFPAAIVIQVHLLFGEVTIPVRLL